MSVLWTVFSRHLSLGSGSLTQLSSAWAQMIRSHISIVLSFSTLNCVRSLLTGKGLKGGALNSEFEDKEAKAQVISLT